MRLSLFSGQTPEGGGAHQDGPPNLAPPEQQPLWLPAARLRPTLVASQLQEWAQCLDSSLNLVWQATGFLSLMETDRQSWNTSHE